MDGTTVETPLASTSTRARTNEEIDKILSFERPQNLDEDYSYFQDNYRISTPVFEGPLDLLLHLIRKEQLNLYDIPVAKVCEAYLTYLNEMILPDVNIAGEFFVMAATLIHLKSQVLLPQETPEELEDPRLPLVAQLEDLERFRKAAQILDARAWIDRDIYLRPFASPQDIPVESLLEAPLDTIETFQLLIQFKNAIDRTERPPLQIETDPISIREKVQFIGNYFQDQEILDFANLISESPKRVEVVVSFLAILELARLKFVEIIQTQIFGPIQLKKIQEIEGLNMALLEQF